MNKIIPRLQWSTVRVRHFVCIENKLSLNPQTSIVVLGRYPWIYISFEGHLFLLLIIIDENLIPPGGAVISINEKAKQG